MARHYTWRAEYVRCGKARCNTCPHGPYWYGYYWDGAKVRKVYHGKEDPRKPAQAEPRDMSWTWALEVLGVAKNATPDEIKTAYRKLAKATHPDRGGDPESFKLVKRAFDYLSK